VTDALDYAVSDTEEVLLGRSPGHGTAGGAASTASQPGTAERPHDPVADVLGPEAAARARPKPSIFEPALNALRAAWKVVARHQVAGVIVFGLGVLILLLVGYIYVFTPLSEQRAQHTLLQQITASEASSFKLAEGKVPSEGSLVALLQIPSLGLNDAVFQGSSSQVLQKGPGHMPTTPLPGQAGNSVIAGRRATYGAPLGGIGGLKRGDIIRVVDGYGTFRYSVVSILTAQGGKHDVVTQTKVNRLTLVTAGSGVYPTGRLAVIARLTGKPFAANGSPRFRPNPAELGLGGDPASGLLAIGWSVLFLAMLGLTVWLLRRWTQPVVVFLLAAPLLLIVGLFACESFMGFLPATL
jgi:sortase A